MHREKNKFVLYIQAVYINAEPYTICAVFLAKAEFTKNSLYYYGKKGYDKSAGSHRNFPDAVMYQNNKRKEVMRDAYGKDQ